MKTNKQWQNSISSPQAVERAGGQKLPIIHIIKRWQETLQRTPKLPPKLESRDPAGVLWSDKGGYGEKHLGSPTCYFFQPSSLRRKKLKVFCLLGLWGGKNREQREEPVLYLIWINLQAPHPVSLARVKHTAEGLTLPLNV